MESEGTEALVAAPADAPPKQASVVGVLRETASGETRVALVPDDITKLVADGLSVVVEHDAGRAAFYDDAAYIEAGARVESAASAVLAGSDIIAAVRPPSDVALLSSAKANAVFIAFLDPARNPDLIQRLASANLSAVAMELVPRITRAQSMDALSSMATIAGYRSVLLAAEASPRMFPMLITAAGTQPPCRVVVLGVGVAGLQALATARRLGAITEAFDTRPEVKEQVQSVGAKFIEMPEHMELEDTASEGGYAKEMGADFYRHEQEAIRTNVANADAVITTAQIPGKPAPILITENMVSDMKPGAVIVDLAAETGGNCELTKAGETVVNNDVKILGPRNIPGQVPSQASQMYSRNIATLIRLLAPEGSLNLNFDDEIIKGATVTYDGKVLK